MRRSRKASGEVAGDRRRGTGFPSGHVRGEEKHLGSRDLLGVASQAF